MKTAASQAGDADLALANDLIIFPYASTLVLTQRFLRLAKFLSMSSYRFLKRWCGFGSHLRGLFN